MIAEFTGRVPTLSHGAEIAGEVVARLTAGREVLAIADSSVVARGLPGAPSRTIEVDAQTADVMTVRSIAEEIVRRPPEAIVVCGGGTVLDVGKIASLALSPGGLFDFAVEHASISALTYLPPISPSVDVITVPTTLGTSSETNSVAILKNESGHRLIVGRALRPRHAIIDQSSFRTLSPAAVREGAMEAFLRLAGVSTSQRRSTRAENDAVALGRALLDTAASGVVSGSSRLRLARLSAATQRTAALRGEDPYSARHWYLANEVASVMTLRKMVATAAVVPAVWRLIRSGDDRWGDRASLERFWRTATGGVALPLDPSRGIAALVDRWEISLPRRPTAQEIDRIAAATEQHWGHRSPMLKGLVAEDFRDVLRDALWSPHSVGSARRLSRTSTERR